MTSLRPAMMARSRGVDSTLRATLCRRRCCLCRLRSTMCDSNSPRRRPTYPMLSLRRGRRLICRRATINACTCWQLREAAGGEPGGVALNVEDGGGFIGQWDDRQWISKDTSHDNYGEMTGIKPGYIKRADLAWYCSHHHDAGGENVPYGYSYLFAYPIDLPAGTKTITLPDNDKIRILAISVADENAAVKPTQPLYDVLPSPATGA